MLLPLFCVVLASSILATDPAGPQTEADTAAQPADQAAGSAIRQQIPLSPLLQLPPLPLLLLHHHLLQTPLPLQKA